MITNFKILNKKSKLKINFYYNLITLVLYQILFLYILLLFFQIKLYFLKRDKEKFKFSLSCEQMEE